MKVLAICDGGIQMGHGRLEVDKKGNDETLYRDHLLMNIEHVCASN